SCWAGSCAANSMSRAGLVLDFGFWIFILAAPDFELAAQDPAQQDEKAECRSNQDDRVEDEDVDLDAEIALVRAEENIRAAAVTIIILLHLGVRDQIGDFLVDVDL